MTPKKRGPYRVHGLLEPALYVRLTREQREAVERLGKGTTLADKIRNAIAEWAVAKALGLAAGGLKRGHP